MSLQHSLFAAGRGWVSAPARLLAACACVCAMTARPLIAQCPDGTPPPCSRPVRVAAAPAPSANSLAVLYFDNLSRDTADAYLADGLTEEVITRLGQIERLAVKPRSAVRRFKGTTDDPATVGRTLGVANLVTGSVRRAGNRLRVTVELVQAAGTVRLWGDAYDRTDGDIFAIQEDIARQVATAVAGQLAPAERASLSARPTRNAAAYDRLLRGNFYLAQRTELSVRRAIGEFQAAAQADPLFTTAIARTATAIGVYVSWGWSYPGLTRDSMAELGVTAADRALAQDSSNAFAWEARGAVALQRRPLEVPAALVSVRRAVALDPRNAEAWHLAGWMISQMGDDSASSAAYRRALALEPGRAVTLEHLARMSIRGRRFHEAEALLDSALAADPGFFFAYVQRASLRARLGDARGARRDAETAAGLSSGDRARAEAALAVAEVAEGDTAAARARFVRVLQNDSAAAYLAWITFAPALLAVGDTARALDVLEHILRSAEAGVWLKRPEYDSLRGDPRFKRIVAENQPR